MRLVPPGRKTAPDQVEKLIKLVQSPPPPHASYWPLRALADRLDMVISTVFNILKEHKLSPHQVRTFKVSRDPDFENKLTDVVGLYVNPPDHAVVLSVDEKTQIQALGRTRTYQLFTLNSMMFLCHLLFHVYWYFSTFIFHRLLVQAGVSER